MAELVGGLQWPAQSAGVLILGRLDGPSVRPSDEHSDRLLTYGQVARAAGGNASLADSPLLH